MKSSQHLRIAGAAAILFAISSLPAAAQTAKAALKSADGKDAGSATLTQTPPATCRTCTSRQAAS